MEVVAGIYSVGVGLLGGQTSADEMQVDMKLPHFEELVLAHIHIFGLAMVVRFDMLDFLAVAVETAGPGDFVVPADIQEAVVVEIYLELLAPE